MKNIFGKAILLATALLFSITGTSCSSDDDEKKDSVKEITIYVSSETGESYGFNSTPEECMLVKFDNPNGKWEHLGLYRIEGFTSTLSEKGERIHIVETIENHDDDNESYEKVKEMLASHPEINVLYFAAGGVAGGCRAAVESGRIDAMRIFTYDCVPSTKKLLDDGIITATICQQPYKQGYLPVELLSRYLIEGISCEEFHYTDIDIRIKENL